VAPRFGAELHRLRLRAGDLDRAQAGDDALAEILAAHATQLLARLPETSDLVAQVRAAVRQRIAEGASLEAVARRLELSARTLQRRLTEQGITFLQLVDDERRELALQLLAAPATSAAEVAFAVGFSEQSAFHRAFVRWTGKTPGAWRRER